MGLVKELIDALNFYADPETWHAVMLWGDRPCGEIADDYSEDHGHPDYDRPMPGARARQALRGIPIDVDKAELEAWRDGVLGASIIARPPREGEHTEEAFLAHKARYEAGGPYCDGADVVSEIDMQRREAIRERDEARLVAIGAATGYVPGGHCRVCRTVHSNPKDCIIKKWECELVPDNPQSPPTDEPIDLSKCDGCEHRSGMWLCSLYACVKEPDVQG